jgi:hypothetical protein
MEELSEIVQNFINNEKRLLIKRLCNQEYSLLNKEQELINKYINDPADLIHSKKKIKLSNEFDNMDFLNNDSLESEKLESEVKNLDLNQTENPDEIDIESLNHKFKNMSLKSIQKICENKSINIYKISTSSGKTVKKTKKELMDTLISNS